MYDLYLRAPTEADMMQLLRDHSLAWTETDDEGNSVERIGGEPPTSVHIIGIMQRQTGTSTDDDGNEVPVYEDMPGWHANVRTRDPELAHALCCMEAEPATPSIVWAGGEGRRMARADAASDPQTDREIDELAYPEKYEPEPTPEAVQTVLDTKPNLLGGTNITKLLKGLSDSELQLALELETRPVVRTLIRTQMTLRGLL